MENIGGFGLSITLVASVTFPAGLTLTQFADDADPFDSESIQITDTAMGLNGDLLRWSKASKLPITLNIIPGSDDDANLTVLAEANRVGKGKQSAQDDISLVGIYPDGTVVNFLNGVLTDAVPTSSVASAGRLKTKPYKFAFENKA
jgi:hypothetical protein